jgi:demethylmenaquinone methyltransferase/2-methoxy-6-polyprenyl-1,4-benzoquinol methylase
VLTTLPSPRSGPEKDAALVRSMFDRVARRYDLANTVFSIGQDRHWRRVAARAVAPQPGEVIIDVAAGTGALASELRCASGGRARVVALDFSWNMLAVGVRRDHARGSSPVSARRLLWCNADGNRLPFADASVDAITIAFGLRNLPRPAAGLAEFARVVRPGGRLVVLEFSEPVWAPFRHVYRRYLVGAIPAAARLLTSDPGAYRYLADSIVAWPDQEGLARLLAEAGWHRPRWRNLTGGIVAVHHALRG